MSCVLAYKKILDKRCVSWGGELLQPLCRSIDHLIAIMIRTMENETAGDDDLKLTAKEALAWMSQHMVMK